MALREALAVPGAAPSPETAPDNLPERAPATRRRGPSTRAVERFDAYAHGVVEGGAVAEFFRADLPRIELEASAIRNALARRAPDPERALFAALAHDLTDVIRGAHAALDDAETDAGIRRLLFEEHLERPLAALERALAEMAALDSERGDQHG